MNPGFCVATLHATFLSLILQGLPKPVSVRDIRILRKRVEVAPNERNHLIAIRKRKDVKEIGIAINLLER